MSKQILFGNEAIQKILVGINKTADAVRATLGPKGRNAFIDDAVEPRITNDGVSIANAIVLEDKFENMGAYLVKNTASQTNDNAGDGTTTTALLLQELISKCLTLPINPVEIKRSLTEATKNVVTLLKKQAIPVKTNEQIKQIAIIASESEKYGSMIAEIVGKVGKNGVISVEDGRTFDTNYEIAEGYEAYVGFMSPYFITNPTKGIAEYENVHIACVERKISTIADIKYLYEQLDQAQVRNLVLVCSDIETGVLGVILQNKIQGQFSTLVIQAGQPLLDDIAASTGATVISDTTGITFDKVTIKDLGKAVRVSCTAKKTIFVGKSKTARSYAQHLENIAKTTPNPFEKKKYMERVAKLRGGVAIIHVGGFTDMEKRYLKDKLEDAVNAVKAAVEEGIVEGGGIALWRIGRQIKPTTIGDTILQEVLKSPLRTIIENAGKDYADVCQQLNTFGKGIGYDARIEASDNDIFTGKTMFENGIIDPLKVVRCALENAVSTACEFITISSAITDYVEKKD